MTWRWPALALLLAASPVWAQSESWCLGESRTMQRDLTLNGTQLPAMDRLLMERRLNDADRLCGKDPGRATSDLDNLRRDMLLQAERPRNPPSEPWRKSWE